ncbi:MAG: hydroxylamine reductase, partial [Oligoflexia bacterium]|nr:hydroxylamine reductase [Oligoflexia bacterium]
MSMFCFQCQEAMKGEGCNAKKGMCGKSEEVANLQDSLIHIFKEISVCAEKGLSEKNEFDPSVGKEIIDGLFATVTNANFSVTSFNERIKAATKLMNELVEKFNCSLSLND